MSDQIRCDICGGCSHDGVKFPDGFRCVWLERVVYLPYNKKIYHVCVDCESEVAARVIFKRNA